MPRTGNLIIVSGPSGAGKSALATSALNSVPSLSFSVSYTTRAPRGNERDGIEYHFVSEPEFQRLVREEEFLEWAEVYGYHYGTSRSSIEAKLGQGLDVLLDVDVQGARSIRARRPESISVFILPPSYHVLRARLESRRLDKEYVIEQRLRIARQEITQYKDFDYLIINDDFENSVAELKAIILGSRCRRISRSASAESIVSTFGGSNAEDP